MGVFIVVVFDVVTRRIVVPSAVNICMRISSYIIVVIPMSEWAVRALATPLFGGIEAAEWTDSINLVNQAPGYMKGWHVK